MIAMAKPSSIPVRNRASRIKRPTIPTITSFIFPSCNLHDIADQDQRLYEATDGDAPGNRIEGHLQRHGDLTCHAHVQAFLDKICTYDRKKGYTHYSGEDQHDSPSPFRQFEE